MGIEPTSRELGTPSISGRTAPTTVSLKGRCSALPGEPKLKLESRT
jgi:hypothetical protein